MNEGKKRTIPDLWNQHLTRELYCFNTQLFHKPTEIRQVKIFYTITIYESLHTYMHTPDTFLLFYSQSIRNQRLNITSTNQ